MRVMVDLDGVEQVDELEPRVLLIEWLRRLGKTGAHIGCDTSSCGACTVLLDGDPVKACTVLAVQADGASIETIHGLTPDEGLSPVQQAFVDEHGLQCGFCTPGFVVSATALLRDVPAPTDAEIIEALEGNLCRCTGYVSIVRAVRRAAEILAGRPPGDPVAGMAHLEPLAVTEVRGGPSIEDLSDTEVV